MTTRLDIDAISQAVDDARAAKGWSAAELARRVEVDASTLWKVLHAKSHVKDATYYKIDEVLGWPKGATLGIGHGEPAPNRTLEQRVTDMENTVEDIRQMLMRRLDGRTDRVQ